MCWISLSRCACSSFLLSLGGLYISAQWVILLGDTAPVLPVILHVPLTYLPVPTYPFIWRISTHELSGGGWSDGCFQSLLAAAIYVSLYV